MKRTGTAFLIIFAGLSNTSYASDIIEFGNPANIVTSCTWYQKGYFKLPGFDTCIKIGGKLQADVQSDNLSKEEDNKFTDTAAYIESRLSFDTKTQIGPFTLATYSGVKYIWDQEDASAEIEADRAAIELSNDFMNLSGGIQESLYTGFTGYSKLNLAGEPWSDNETLQLTLKIPAGPLNFGFSIEDVVYEDVDPGKVYYVSKPRTLTENDYAFIGMIEYLSDYLDVKVSGVVSDISETQYIVPYREPGSFGNPKMLNMLTAEDASYNYAVNFNTEIKSSDIFKFTFAAHVGAGAMGYTGVDMNNYKVPVFDFTGFNPPPEPDEMGKSFLRNDVAGFRNALMNAAAATSYSLVGGFELHLLENVFLGFDASYQAFDLDEQGIEFTGTGFTAGSTLIWKPSSNLNVYFGAGYGTYSVDGFLPTKGDKGLNLEHETDNLKIGSRIKYVFDPQI